MLMLILPVPRKVRRAYESSWDQRCRMFFCCSLASNRKIRVSIQMTVTPCNDIMTRTRVSHSGYSQLWGLLVLGLTLAAIIMATCEERGTLCQHDRSGSIFLYSYHNKNPYHRIAELLRRDRASVVRVFPWAGRGSERRAGRAHHAEAAAAAGQADTHQPGGV